MIIESCLHCSKCITGWFLKNPQKSWLALSIIQWFTIKVCLYFTAPVNERYHEDENQVWSRKPRFAWCNWGNVFDLSGGLPLMMCETGGLQVPGISCTITSGWTLVFTDWTGSTLAWLAWDACTALHLWGQLFIYFICFMDQSIYFENWKK